jgi:hypothetical protein
MIVMASQADAERTRQALQAAIQRVGPRVTPPGEVAKFDAEYTFCDFYLGLSDQYLTWFNESLEAGDEKQALQYLATSSGYFHQYVTCGDGSVP